MRPSGLFDKGKAEGTAQLSIGIPSRNRERLTACYYYQVDLLEMCGVMPVPMPVPVPW